MYLLLRNPICETYLNELYNKYVELYFHTIQSEPVSRNINEWRTVKINIFLTLNSAFVSEVLGYIKSKALTTDDSEFKVPYKASSSVGCNISNKHTRPSVDPDAKMFFFSGWNLTWGNEWKLLQWRYVTNWYVFYFLNFTVYV